MSTPITDMIAPEHLGKKHCQKLDEIWNHLQEWYELCSAPFPVDHGKKHIIAVSGILCRFLRVLAAKDFLPDTKEWSEAQLCVFQLFVAALIHDLGMKYVALLSKEGDQVHRKRHSHKDTIQDCCKDAGIETQLQPADLDCAKMIAWAHTGGGTDESPDEKLRQIDDIGERPGYYHLPLCARLLRFADLLDLGPGRLNRSSSRFEHRDDQTEHRDLHQFFQITLGPFSISLQPTQPIFGGQRALSAAVDAAIARLDRSLRAQLTDLSRWLKGWTFQRMDVAMTTTSEADSTPLSAGITDSFGLGGIVSFIPRRLDLRRDWWQDSFFSASKRPRVVDLMSQTMLPVFENAVQCKAFARWCNDYDTCVRILLLSPSPREYSQIIAVGQGVESGRSSPDPLAIIPAKILGTLKFINDNVSRHIANPAQKPSIRFAHCNLPYCLNVIDDDMYVTLYGTQAEGNEQPTLRVHGRETTAFKAFMHEFNTIWNTKSSVSPSEDPVLLRYRDRWSEMLPLRSILNQETFDPNAVLPPPAQAILFSTWRCTAKCSYCMFDGHHGNGVVDMPVAALEQAILQLAEYGVRHFEITGGGEPFDHPESDAIVEMITRLRKTDNSLHFGLLTNGLALPNPADPLLDAFDEYIRISFCEAAHKSADDTETPVRDAYAQWRSNVSRVLAAKRTHRNATTMIGIKMLLTRSNQSSFVHTASRLLADRTLSGIDHWRLRAARSVEREVVPEIEQAIFHQLSEIPPWENISLALSHTQYPRNFKCWLSPIQTTIAPDGSVYVCCNYLSDQDRRYIGNIHTERFASLWNSSKHFRVRKAIDGAACARTCYANCRFAELQAILDPIAAHLGQT